MPFYEFVDGETVTAAILNEYLSKQVIMTFASSAARATALSGVLAQGMHSYLADTDAFERYNGSTWEPAASPASAVARLASPVSYGSGVSVLSVPVFSGAEYAIEAALFVSQPSNTPHPVFGWTTPSGSSGSFFGEGDTNVHGISPETIARTDQTAIGSTWQIAGNIGNGGSLYTARGLFTAGASGSLVLVATSGGTGGSVNAGSYLIVRALT